VPGADVRVRRAGGRAVTHNSSLPNPILHRPARPLVRAIPAGHGCIPGGGADARRTLAGAAPPGSRGHRAPGAVGTATVRPWHGAGGADTRRDLAVLAAQRWGVLEPRPGAVLCRVGAVRRNAVRRAAGDPMGGPH